MTKSSRRERRDPRFLQLRERVGDLPHGDFERIIRIGQVVAAGGHDADSASDQGEDAKFLRHQLAGSCRQDRHHD